MDKINLSAEVKPASGIMGGWFVGADDADGDGEVYAAIFWGANAKKRAEEYAREKFLGAISVRPEEGA